jgi:hypothetical protein
MAGHSQVCSGAGYPLVRSSSVGHLPRPRNRIPRQHGYPGLLEGAGNYSDRVSTKPHRARARVPGLVGWLIPALRSPSRNMDQDRLYRRPVIKGTRPLSSSMTAHHVRIRPDATPGMTAVNPICQRRSVGILKKYPNRSARKLTRTS